MSLVWILTDKRTKDLFGKKILRNEGRREGNFRMKIYSVVLLLLGFKRVSTLEMNIDLGISFSS